MTIPTLRRIMKLLAHRRQHKFFIRTQSTYALTVWTTTKLRLDLSRHQRLNISNLQKTSLTLSLWPSCIACFFLDEYHFQLHTCLQKSLLAHTEILPKHLQKSPSVLPPLAWSHDWSCSDIRAPKTCSFCCVSVKLHTPTSGPEFGETEIKKKTPGPTTHIPYLSAGSKTTQAENFYTNSIWKWYCFTVSYIHHVVWQVYPDMQVQQSKKRSTRCWQLSRRFFWTHSNFFEKLGFFLFLFFSNWMLNADKNRSTLQFWKRKPLTAHPLWCTVFVVPGWTHGRGARWGAPSGHPKTCAPSYRQREHSSVTGDPFPCQGRDPLGGEPRPFPQQIPILDPPKSTKLNGGLFWHWMRQTFWWFAPLALQRVPIAMPA